MRATDLVVCLYLMLQVLPYPFADVNTDPSLPNGNDVWTLQVLSRGGLDGRGEGNILVNSEGALNCSRKTKDCAKNVNQEIIGGLSRIITSLKPPMWSNSSLGQCNDCFSTLIRLKIRDRDGAVQTYFAYWDTTTQGRISAELFRLYTKVTALR